MPQIQKGDTFTNGQQVDATRLNQLVDSSVLLVGAITEQPAMTTNTVTADDTTIIADGGVLKKVTAGSLLGSNLPINTSSITGATGVDIVITPASGREVDIAGNFQVIGNDIVTGNSTVGGTFAVTGPASFNTNTAIKIPVGTTVQRPSTPIAGQLRYNSTLDQAEVYSGTEWKAVGGSPFEASGGSVTTINGFRIHTFTTSGTFTPSLNAEGKVEVLVVGAGGAGAGGGFGGGGGGGDVKTGFVTISKGTSPMPVVVGSGSSGTGGASSFGTFTSNGGTSGGGTWGGTSGSGIAGNNGGGNGGGGGGGAQTGCIFQWTDAGGIGGQGYGSSISGTLRVYGGGGGGGSSNGSVGMGTIFRASAPGIYGGGGQGVAPIANSGGGGGGGGQGAPATLGADGIVIIRYRVS